jgi:hypothetical protein
MTLAILGLIPGLVFLAFNYQITSLTERRIRPYIILAPQKNLQNSFLWGFLRLRITVGHVGDGKNVYYKMYLGSITLMKTYPALFAAIGGRDGMDAGGVHQMTCAIYRTCQPLQPHPHDRIHCPGTVVARY